MSNSPPVSSLGLPATLELPPRTVSIPDPDGSQVPSYLTASAQILRIGASCTNPDCSLWGRVYFLDSSGNPLAVETVQFASGVAADWGATFTGIPGGPYTWWLSGAAAVAFKVDRVSGGNWTLTGAMA